MDNNKKQEIPRDEQGYFQYSKDMVMFQEYEKYTEDDHKVWKILFERQLQNLPGKATEDYLKGIKIVNFTADKIPNFEEVNKILTKTTGWKVYVVPGLIPVKEFFELMHDRNFCATTWLRKMNELDYLEEPDMFHDVFGHVPLLSNQSLCDFLVKISKIALKHINSPLALEYIARLYWFTVEFGLIQDAEGLRIYGAGILSSSGETDFCLFNDTPKRIPYNPKEVMNTPYIKDRYQDQYFIIESFEQLYSSVDEIEKIIDEAVMNENSVLAK